MGEGGSSGHLAQGAEELVRRAIEEKGGFGGVDAAELGEKLVHAAGVGGGVDQRSGVVTPLVVADQDRETPLGGLGGDARREGEPQQRGRQDTPPAPAQRPAPAHGFSSNQLN